MNGGTVTTRPSWIVRSIDRVLSGRLSVERWDAIVRRWKDRRGNSYQPPPLPPPGDRGKPPRRDGGRRFVLWIRSQDRPMFSHAREARQTVKAWMARR